MATKQTTKPTTPGTEFAKKLFDLGKKKLAETIKKKAAAIDTKKVGEKLGKKIAGAIGKKLGLPQGKAGRPQGKATKDRKESGSGGLHNAAVALGRAGKGIPKNISAQERADRALRAEYARSFR